jgi:catechol 2,3-dioxygenase-like lactoylglutathione lyase family enzyme
MVTKLAHVCIESADLDATEAFYACLGMRRQFEFRNPAGLLVGYYLKFDDQTFIEVIRVQSVRTEGAVRHFAIESDDIAALRAALLAAGFEASEKHLASDHTWMVTCRDPNGIFIELQQYDVNSMQQHGGTCLVDYAPRPSAA